MLPSSKPGAPMPESSLLPPPAPPLPMSRGLLAAWTADSAGRGSWSVPTRSMAASSSWAGVKPARTLPGGPKGRGHLWAGGGW